MDPIPPTISERAHEAFWRSVEQAQGEFIAPVPGWGVDTVPLASRRRFMKWMGAAVALSGVAGCGRQSLETIVPYRSGPQQALYGKPVFYATAVPRQGCGVGVLVECNMGRPTKLEGNPTHPASLGATDAVTQAEVLQLWDPDRAQVVTGPAGISTWNDFVAALHAEAAQWSANGGDGVHVLTETVTSPSLYAQIDGLRSRLPRIKWHQYRPITRDHVLAGAQLAYGTALETTYRLDRARVIVSLDADFLDAGPAAVRYAHDFSALRNGFADARNRMYVAECTPSLTGAAADHRVPVRASDVALVAHALAHRLGIAPAPATDAPIPVAWLDAVISDLQANRGASIVIAGDRQPAIVHAVVCLINERVGNVGTTLTHTAPVAFEPVDHLASLRDLALAMHAGDVRALIVIDANPVYTAPPEQQIAEALAKVPFSAHLGLYGDETGRRCRWHVPGTHALEAWGDVRAFDGTVTIQQPCIAPLYNGKSALEMVATIVGDVDPEGRSLVRRQWQSAAGGQFDAWWRDALREGIVPGSALPPQRVSARADAIAWNEIGTPSEVIVSSISTSRFCGCMFTSTP